MAARRRLAESIGAVHPRFAAAAFVRDARPGLESPRVDVVDTAFEPEGLCVGGRVRIEFTIRATA